MSVNRIKVLLYFSFVLTIGHFTTIETCTDFCHVENHCILRCSSENGTDNAPSDLWCDGGCRRDHCISGCRRWAKALNTNCYAACNSTDGHTRGQAIYCLRGCNLAISSYVDDIKARMGRIVAPIPIAGSISNTSVTLEWKWNATALGLLHRNHVINVSIKWCHSQPEMCSAWEAVPNATERSGQSLVTVNELRPYTIYRFRLVIVLASDREPLTSEESAPVVTLPSGLPSSPPINLEVVVLDANRISITWDPPYYPNGPLISYSLNIQEASSRKGYQGSQDVGANNHRSYTFVHLKPNTTYIVSVAACNSVGGVGPAASRHVTTYPLEKLPAGNDLKPYFLIVVDDKFIYRHEPGLIDYTKSPIHESQSTAITGLAVHARQGTLFLADDDGYVYELSLKPKSDIRNRWRVGKEIVHVIGLSVDWLFDRLYLLIENDEGTSWQISRCKLDGRESAYVVTDLTYKPSHFEVDPFNGFLVWTVNHTDATGGLYIVDLADLADQPLSAMTIETGPTSKIQHILHDVAISAFKADPINSRIFVMVNDVSTNRTILAVPYSGLWKKVVRHSMRDVEAVSYMAYLDDVFYWTNLGHSFFEEADPNRDIHVHRFAPKAESRHTAIILCDIRSQPTPIPLTPVRNLEAIFGSDSVYVKWDPPSTVAHRGRGAWQNWSYHVQIGDMERDISVSENDINTTEMTLKVLRPNTTYSIVVQPASDYDRRYAPLRPIPVDSSHVVSVSAYFFGKTLPSGEEIRPIYWATDDGVIYQSNSVGDDVRSFISVNSSHLNWGRHALKDVVVTNMAWMHNSMYVVTNTNRMYHVDLTSRNVTLLEGLEASSVATDWLSRKVYWSSANRQTIGRCAADGSGQEWLPIIGRATSMAVHSTKGKLVWCTGHSVEGSFLNADNRQTYWSSGLHSGNQALGMAIDYDNDDVYWLVKKLNGASLLYRTHIDSAIDVSLINEITPNARGPLQYMSGRLIWLQDSLDKIVISDLNGTNTYQLNSPKQLRVSWFLPTHFSRSYNSTTAVVIPDPVDAASILLKPVVNEGLVISWSHVTNVNYGNVAYDIRVSYREDNCTAVTADDHYPVPSNWKILPYSDVSVSIRAFTVWGSANVSNVILKSPPSTPEVPLKPRAFVSFVRNDSSSLAEVVIHFRWSPPAKSNGELAGYRVTYCRETSESQHRDCQNANVSPSATEFVARNVGTDDYYVFTVKAFTEVGYGPETRTLEVSTSIETPIPHLVIFTSNLLWLADLDNHASLNQSVAKRAISVPSPPVAVALINHDRKVYWIDTQGDFYSHDLRSDDIKKIHHLNGTGESLTIDWVSRHAYWSQREMGVSSVYQLDLNKKTDEYATPQLVLRDPRMVRLVEVDPFSSRLIWVSDNHNGTGTLMTTDIRGGQNRIFFNNPQYCGVNSLRNNTLTPPLALQTITTIDWSDTHKPRLIWTAHNDDIWSSDLKGCFSTPELSSSEIKRTGRWPISSLAADRTHFYWTDVKERRVHKMRRLSSILDRNKFLAQSGSISAFASRSEVLVELANVYKVVTFSTNFQPLPDVECLAPSSYPYNVKFVNSTHDSLTLSMPMPQRPAKCNGMTMAPPTYHLYYGEIRPNQTGGCRHNLSQCLTETSNDSVVFLRKLLPNTKYVVHVSITNHYMPVGNSLPNITLDNADIFSTQVGAPSKPREVVAIVTSPVSVRVQWLQPSSLNGINITYSVHWLSENKFGSPIEGQLKLSEDVEDQAGPFRYFIDITSLTANTTYAFMVRAYSSNGQFNQSDFVTTTTFENPKALVMRNVSSTSVLLEWKSPNNTNITRHILLCSVSKQGIWKEIEHWSDTKPDHTYNFSAIELSPKTSYSFRLKLEYSPLKTSFLWPADDDGILLTTKGNVPDQPLSPRANKIVDNLIELWWGTRASNDYPILRYVLEMRCVEDPVFLDRHDNETDSGITKTAIFPNTQSSWKPIYNGTDNFYIVPNLKPGPRYQFRVQAFNEMGASEVSDASPIFQTTSNNTNITMIVLVSALIAFCSVMTIFLFYVCRRTQFQGKKAGGNMSSHPIGGSEMTDLATLRELPRRESFIQQNNAIYGVGDGDVDQELALLPHIRFEDLLITKFLGRGAFGEVFEGTTCNLPGSNQYHTKVAVKTLRKGATDQEKGEFLKEAILMSQFKHKHILRLLGVCLDADPSFILLELMEGGDLLSFLRNNRPSLREPPANSATCCQLGLLDLVSMCVDVAKGCCYLEELHFVHRDLAARNCLVSSRDPRFRVVKIGDFGLARDIYRNDYYRKEGEGLLPVRWMAPESLVDGVFTSQTDVWSFGVLLWEILTLGQQPYPARTNLQVLHFVRTGGRLDRPPNCPDSLFELMMSCWSYEPSARPTFTKCLAELLNLQDKLQHSPFTAVHNGHYVGAPLYQTNPWQINRDSVESGDSCSYLDQHSLEQGPTLYTNDIAAVLHGLVSRPNTRHSSSGNRTHRVERCSSVRDSRGRQHNANPSISIIRSHSTIEGSTQSVASARGRYLELLGDTVVCGHGCSDGYEVPRNISYESSSQMFTDALLQRSHSSNSQVDNDDLSDATDESCLANESVCASIPSPTNTLISTLSASTMPSEMNHL
ncbi:hypothetical protein OUZ56_031022 [Daphnia magna]|uniref:Tyrosine-protein kinase receptor n=1 Tax=Daphnia magna TaxID=35525 RepID=A0ABQ9ZTI8_9CRUS|nr:hypothetical protein OUZ56_031022 [Daphnia magna]